MFRVKELFIDLQDNGHRYEVGDEYPRLGLKPSLARISELSGEKNKRGIALIEEIPDLEEEPKAEEPEKSKKTTTKKSSSSKKNSNK
jgi:hypothetical protein